MNTPIAKSIPEYLEQLRAALAGSDPALVQDALYDAEDYLRSEWAEHPEMDEASLLASVAGSYGAPSEVADIYRDTEVTVHRALRAPPPKPRVSLAGRFFGVLADPHAYTSVLYLLLSLATGIFYFTWVVTGLSLSASLAVLIIGIPFTILFFASVRGLSLVEGRLVEVMLGERMPRRPLYTDRERPILERIKTVFLDPRTWSTLVYMVLMLPLGVIYFTFIVVALSLTFAVAALPVLDAFGDHNHLYWFGEQIVLPLWSLPITIAIGLLMLILTLHAARGLGKLQATLAKHQLVKSAQT
ncbi:MAG: sensor domain-containing protein [Gammaproteobacteria bacterium]|nr:sensor domain-containing protein [Gammaproteobacteria bacterium]